MWHDVHDVGCTAQTCQMRCTADFDAIYEAQCLGTHVWGIISARPAYSPDSVVDRHRIGVREQFVWAFLQLFLRTATLNRPAAADAYILHSKGSS